MDGLRPHRRAPETGAGDGYPPRVDVIARHNASVAGRTDGHGLDDLLAFQVRDARDDIALVVVRVL